MREQKATEAALRASEQRFRQIVTTANEGIWVLDPESRTLFCNDALAHILDCPIEIIQQRSLRDFLAPETQPLLSEHMQRRRQGIPEQYELPLVRPDGSVVYCWVSASPIFDEAGHFVSSLALLTDITERKHIENRLRRSEAHLKLAQRISGLGSWEFEVATRAIRWSAEVYRIFDVFAHGIEPSYEELAQVILDREAYQAAVERAITHAIPYELECRYRRADGSIGYFAGRGEPIQDSQGQVVRLIGTVVDITSRKQAELALQAKTDELDRFFSLSADLLFIGDREGRILRLNSGWEKLLGYPLAVLEGQHFMDFIHPDDQAATAAASLMLLSGETAPNVVNRFRCQDGSYRWLDWRAVISGEQIFAVARDITERLAAEAEQRKQAERERLLREISQRIRESLDLQTIFDTACQEIRAVLDADRVGIFTFEPDSGCDSGHFVAESVLPPFPSALETRIQDHCFGDRYAPLYAQGRYAAMDDIYMLEVCHTSVLSQIAVRANLVMPLICGGRLWGLLCVHQCYSSRHWETPEIEFTQQLANQLAIAIQQANLVEQLQSELSERQQAQAQLSERNQQLAINVEELARATRLKDEFLANMSHELRTPLNAILGMTEALSETTFGPITPQQHKALSTIDRSGSHLLSLINDILDMAKIESGQFELALAPTSLTSLCEASLSFVKQQAHKKQLKICTNITNALTHVLADELRLRQALINLLNNAVKFTPSGGGITLNVEPSPDRKHLRFSVCDTGIGIAAADIPKLFQPFVQIDSALNRQYAGTGLGLSLVKRIAVLHGGNVHLTSEVGVGSCFSLDIPCTELPAASPTDPEPPSTATCSPQAATVLLVEDNEANILTLGSYLEAKGFAVHYADNGQAALDQIRNAPPDLVIMDIQMPGMDGLTATRHIRETLGLQDLPIIALTALAMQGDRDRCLAAGATDYLSKPVQLKALVTLIQQLLASSTTTAQTPT